jgi:hypothetical protein
VDKRSFLKYAGGGGLALAFSSAGLTWISIEESDAELTTNSIIEIIDKLLVSNQLNTIESAGQWSAYKVFMHCAESVDYSIAGYPKHNSTMFKKTVGKMAFSAFSAKRKMSHNLAEEIPGTDSIANTGNVAEALKHLKMSLLKFEAFSGDLQAHFAYGELTKPEYEVAHAMHFLNHLQEFTFTSKA